MINKFQRTSQLVRVCQTVRLCSQFNHAGCPTGVICQFYWWSLHPSSRLGARAGWTVARLATLLVAFDPLAMIAFGASNLHNGAILARELSLLAVTSRLYATGTEFGCLNLFYLCFSRFQEGTVMWSMLRPCCTESRAAAGILICCPISTSFLLHHTPICPQVRLEFNFLAVLAPVLATCDGQRLPIPGHHRVSLVHFFEMVKERLDVGVAIVLPAKIILLQDLGQVQRGVRK